MEYGLFGGVMRNRMEYQEVCMFNPMFECAQFSRTNKICGGQSVEKR